ncbi:MAG TPA: GGDEF domain-containing protein [Magnetospirillum sp.]|nr:GGDEF domain-containing protein [Magnetospirillum sp.]
MQDRAFRHIQVLARPNSSYAVEMLTLDIRTLMVAAALVSAFCAVARIILYRLHPSLPGLDRWALAAIAGVVALGLLAARDVLGDNGLTLAQMVATGGIIVVWDGFRRFAGRPPLPPKAVAGFCVTIVLVGLLYHSLGSLLMRAVINAGAIALVSGAIALELILPPRERGLAERATGCVYALNAAIFGVRCAAGLVGNADAGQDLYSGFATFNLLWWLCANVAVTLGMVLMTGERLQRDLDRQANSDPLTGALNRRAFGLAAERELARAERHGEPLSLLMMDLDHFKRINDSLGHAVGDSALQAFVAVAERTLRGEDVLCRFGGEEFVALLPGSGHDQALAAAERLRSAFTEQAAGLVEHSPVAFTVSIGIAERHSGEDLPNLLRRADAALYQAKEAGRNRSEVAAAFISASQPIPA